MPDLSFSEQLWLTVIDKVLLGTLVGVGALVGNKILESYKSQQQLRIELGKLRVNKIAEVWGALGELDVGLAQALESLEEPHSIPERQTLIAKETAILRRRSRSVGYHALLHRFWLGPTLYWGCRSYLETVDTSVDQLDTWAKGDGEAMLDLTNLLSRLQQCREDVSQLLARARVSNGA